MGKRISISEEKLAEINKKLSIHIVGTILRRIEVFSNLKKEDEEILKKSIKELLYEGLRMYRDSIMINSEPFVVFTSKEKE